ncbi:MAG: hypothetical protein MI975_01790 [Cytophagales bacterium]|nr:hypothetical protein [Cytophagales bacterium]
MDIKRLNEDLCKLVSRRNLLAAIDYNDEAYDEVEQDLHDFEDDFLDEYNDYLEDVFKSVHEKYCPDNDVLLPIAYIAKKYIEKTDEGGNVSYGVGPNEGVLVETDEYPKSDVRLILVPSPTRIVMTVDNANPEIVWEAG